MLIVLWFDLYLFFLGSSIIATENQTNKTESPPDLPLLPPKPGKLNVIESLKFYKLFLIWSKHMEDWKNLKNPV